MPLSIVGDAIGLVVELTEAFHFVELPVALVETAILIVEFSEAMFLAIQFIALISAALPVLFCHIITGVAADSIGRGI